MRNEKVWRSRRARIYKGAHPDGQNGNPALLCLHDPSRARVRERIEQLIAIGPVRIRMPGCYSSVPGNVFGQARCESGRNVRRYK